MAMCWGLAQEDSVSCPPYSATSCSAPSFPPCIPIGPSRWGTAGVNPTGHRDPYRTNFAGRRNPLSVLHTVTNRNTPLLQPICLFVDISIVQSYIRYKRAARSPFWANGSNIRPSAHWARKDFDCNVTQTVNHKSPNKGLTTKETPCKQKNWIDSRPRSHSDKLIPALCDLRRYQTRRKFITTKETSL